MRGLSYNGGQDIAPFSGIIVKLLLKLIKSLSFMKPLRQTTTRPIISYKPRVEPAAPVHAQRLDGYNDVYQIKGQYMAFVLLGDTFKQSPVFAYPESAQRWANQTRQNSND